MCGEKTFSNKTGNGCKGWQERSMKRSKQIQWKINTNAQVHMASVEVRREKNAVRGTQSKQRPGDLWDARENGERLVTG